jgi:hypothetical protein
MVANNTSHGLVKAPGHSSTPEYHPAGALSVPWKGKAGLAAPTMLSNPPPNQLNHDTPTIQRATEHSPAQQRAHRCAQRTLGPRGHVQEPCPPAARRCTAQDCTVLQGESGPSCSRRVPHLLAHALGLLDQYCFAVEGELRLCQAAHPSQSFSTPAVMLCRSLCHPYQLPAFCLNLLTVHPPCPRHSLTAHLLQNHLHYALRQRSVHQRVQCR